MRNRNRLFPITVLIALGGNLSLAAADPASATSGSSSESEAPLVGIFYDLKQTPDHKPSNVDPETYTTIIDDFLSQGWDDTVLNRYYRVSRPLHTTQLFVPTLNADMAPQAFGVQKYVEGTRWVALYKGQVSPPEPGTYRFWGIADDIMAVAVNGKTVLVGQRPDMKLPKTNWQASERDGAHAGDGELRPGDWITIKAGDIIDLDIMVGDRPGGVFNVFMMVEKQGGTYESDHRGHPILPIFQVAPFDTPKSGDARFSTDASVWKCYQ
jgi:hypothetical protein